MYHGLQPDGAIQWPTNIIPPWDESLADDMVKAVHWIPFTWSHDDKFSAESFGKKGLQITKINTWPGFPRLI